MGAQKLWAGTAMIHANASATDLLECVLCPSDGEAVAVNLDITPVQVPNTVLWIDPTHPRGGV